ncbi:hypothetical protein DL93DRAFT_2083315 [Clavulina sp. PMI_390]|nr:hypothetical protein DL93DRAFT_2083315 [Clavulina sp. PMI_390]
MFESTSSSSQSNGVSAPIQIPPYDGTTSHGARSQAVLVSSPDIPAAPSPELLTVRLRSSEQPIAGSTRYTVWENVIEMPRNTPYPSLSGMRYTFTPYSRVSQVDVPDEGGEDHGNETNDLVGASWDA